MKNPFSIATLLVLLMMPAVAFCQQDPSTSGEVLTLERAISLAFERNRLVKNAELGTEEAEDVLSATRTFRLPSMHVYTLVSEQLVKQESNVADPLSGVVPGLGPFFSISLPRQPTAIFGAQILQPLTQQYRIGLNIEQAGLARDAENQTLRKVKQSIVDEVKRGYYGILQTQSAIDSLQEAIRLYRELDRVTGDYVVQQVALKADSLEVKTRLAKAEYDSLHLTNQLATEKEQLNNLLGRDVSIDFRVARVPEVDGVFADLTVARSRALDLRPEIREAQLKIKQAEVDRRIKKSEYIPDVSVGVTYLTFQNFDSAIPKNSASVGFAMTWEVFDWGRKGDELAAKEKSIERSRNVLREAESLVLIDVSDKFRSLQEARQAVVVAQLAQETARESLRVNVNKYQQTAILLSDVLQSQATLAEADDKYQQALLGFWTAKAQLEKAMGEEK